MQAFKAALAIQFFTTAWEAVANAVENGAASSPPRGGAMSASRLAPLFTDKDDTDFPLNDEADDETSSLSHKHPLSHKSPKPHTRREHLRHLKSGKIVQVSQASVGEKKGDPKPERKKLKEK